MDALVPLEIDVTAFKNLRDRAVPHRVLDVRESWEIGICAFGGCLSIPMGQIPERVQELPTGEILVVLCHHGGRSQHVAAWLRDQGFARATSLTGGSMPGQGESNRTWLVTNSLTLFVVIIPLTTTDSNRRGIGWDRRLS